MAAWQFFSLDVVLLFIPHVSLWWTPAIFVCSTLIYLFPTYGFWCDYQLCCPSGPLAQWKFSPEIWLWTVGHKGCLFLLNHELGRVWFPKVLIRAMCWEIACGRRMRPKLKEKQTSQAATDSPTTLLEHLDLTHVNSLPSYLSYFRRTSVLCK